MLIQTDIQIPILFVIQSEAKNLEDIHVDVPEILRRYAPLDDK